VPRIPRSFYTPDEDSAEIQGNFDVLRQPFTSSSSEPPLVPNLHTAICDLACFLRQSMTYNAENEHLRGSDQDIHWRVKLYHHVMEWGAALPPRLQHDQNFTPQTIHLA
jgi:hypothetical protein